MESIGETPKSVVFIDSSLKQAAPTSGCLRLELSKTLIKKSVKNTPTHSSRPRPPPIPIPRLVFRSGGVKKRKSTEPTRLQQIFRKNMNARSYPDTIELTEFTEATKQRFENIRPIWPLPPPSNPQLKRKLYFVVSPDGSTTPKLQIPDTKTRKRRRMLVSYDSQDPTSVRCIEVEQDDDEYLSSSLSDSISKNNDENGRTGYLKKRVPTKRDVEIDAWENKILVINNNNDNNNHKRHDVIDGQTKIEKKILIGLNQTYVHFPEPNLPAMREYGVLRRVPNPSGGKRVILCNLPVIEDRSLPSSSDLDDEEEDFDDDDDDDWLGLEEEEFCGCENEDIDNEEFEKFDLAMQLGSDAEWLTTSSDIAAKLRIFSKTSEKNLH
ncbi:hypothetical protein G9A89_012248 [Geosiphon pyriformis]|nr:hypothetical protein G9A89_012248 [Geosiphon pyriformis]